MCASNDTRPGLVEGRRVLELFAQLEADDASPVDIAAVLDTSDSELVVAAERFAGRVARLRKRDRELSALISSARELVEVREVQMLLAKLVDRAHELMGADLTYLSEYDESTDELFVRATRGSVSPNLPDLRVPAGIGLASKIVRTRTAQWTADYDHTAEIPHDVEIDDAVHAESMRSLVGVPMIASDHVLGVLFAANRSTHSFSAEEIALLSAFADHAAVVLHTAKLFAAVNRAAADAETAHARAKAHLEEMQRSALVHEELTQHVLAGRGSGEVAATLAGALGRSIAIADRDLELTAATDAFASAWWQQGRLNAAALSALEQSRLSGRCVAVDGEGPAVLVAAVTETALLGVVLVGGSDAELTEVEQRTVERTSQIVALLTMQEAVITDAEERVRGELVVDLVDGGGRTDELQRRSKSRGIELDQPWAAVVVRTADESRRTAHRILSSTRSDWLAGQHRGGVTVLVPGEEPRVAADAVYRMLSSADVVAITVGTAKAVGPEELRSEVDAAWTCAELLAGMGLRDTAVTVDAYAPYLAMFGTDAARAEAFIDATLGPVLDWDTRHGTSLVATVDAFLENASSTARTARVLFLHINTVKQRLERIDTLLGRAWREPETSFRVSVAARLARIKATMA